MKQKNNCEKYKKALEDIRDLFLGEGSLFYEDIKSLDDIKINEEVKEGDICIDINEDGEWYNYIVEDIIEITRNVLKKE